MWTYIFSEKDDTCAFIEELFRLVRIFFLESLSPCTVIKDCTFIRDLRVSVQKAVLRKLGKFIPERHWPKSFWTENQIVLLKNVYSLGVINRNKNFNISSIWTLYFFLKLNDTQISNFAENSKSSDWADPENLWCKRLEFKLNKTEKVQHKTARQICYGIFFLILS